MFRDRPLTWLFILASIAVDSVMFFSGPRAVFEGILVGQIAAVAIWAAIGQSHRLTRGSLLVVAVGVLAIVPYRSFDLYSHTLTFMAAYALVIVVTSLFIVWLRNQVRIRFDGEREEAPLKIPLIEFFGWTIVVAIASLGARYMNVESLERVPRSLPGYLMAYAVAPLALILFDSRFRIAHLVKAVLFVGGVYLTISYLIPNGQFEVEVTSAAAYLSAWLLVRSIEYDQLKTAEEDPDSEEQNGEIKLFDAKQ